MFENLDTRGLAGALVGAPTHKHERPEFRPLAHTLKVSLVRVRGLKLETGEFWNLLASQPNHCRSVEFRESSQ